MRTKKIDYIVYILYSQVVPSSLA